jgi:hypothetical protein
MNNCPPLVQNLQVVNLLNNRRYIIQWDQSSDLSVVLYNVYRSESQFAGFALVNSTPNITNIAYNPQYVDTVPFTFGVNFYWKVTAVDDLGNESNLSATPPVTDITIGQFDEEPFKQVLVQKQDLVYGEIPMGLQNGTNTTYTTLFPFRQGSLQFIRNGIVQTETGPNPDYTEFFIVVCGVQSSGFTVSIPGLTTDTLRINYTKYFD